MYPWISNFRKTNSSPAPMAGKKMARSKQLLQVVWKGTMTVHDGRRRWQRQSWASGREGNTASGALHLKWTDHTQSHHIVLPP